MTSDGADGPPLASFLVLMATRNGEAWLGAQLRSVLEQVRVSLRLRVSDDASTDATPALLRAAALDDDRIELLLAAASSGSACANFLRLIRSVDLATASFTHVALCDQDDLWHPDKLHRAALAMAAHRADLYSSAVTAWWPSGRRKDLVQSASTTEFDHFFEGAGQGCTFVLTRELFDRVQLVARSAPGALLAELHYHDWMIYALTRTWQRRWYHDRVPGLQYRQHASNDTGARGSAAGVRLRMAKIASGWYGRQVQATLALCLHVAPGDAAGRTLDQLARATRRSIADRLRWAWFLGVRSRRRAAERSLLAVFAVLGKF